MLPLDGANCPTFFIDLSRDLMNRDAEAYNLLVIFVYYYNEILIHIPIFQKYFVIFCNSNSTNYF